MALNINYIALPYKANYMTGMSPYKANFMTGMSKTN